MNRSTDLLAYFHRPSIAATLGLAAFLVLFALLSPAHSKPTDNRAAPPIPTDWISTDLTTHPLVGQVYHVPTKRLVTPDELARAIALARFTLLGEIHDNPDHHKWQAWSIRAISKLRGSRIVEGAPQIDMIAMEMLSVDQYDGIDRFYGRSAKVPRRRKARAFGRMVKWKDWGWPDYTIYEPIIAQAQYEQIVVAPASPSRADNRAISKQGLQAYLGADEISRVALDRPLPDPISKELLNELEASHCGLIPTSAFPRMAEVQRYRDAVMADALLSPGNGKGAILIAGNGHVRTDRGVAFYLTARGVKRDAIVALAHVEVVDGETALSDYELTSADGQPLYDFVVFTPRASRPDPCEQMRATFVSIRKQNSGQSGRVTGAAETTEPAN